MFPAKGHSSFYPHPVTRPPPRPLLAAAEPCPDFALGHRFAAFLAFKEQRFLNLMLLLDYDGTSPPRFFPTSPLLFFAAVPNTQLVRFPGD